MLVNFGPYCCSQGLPSIEPADAMTQLLRIDPNAPPSLPPIVIVTRRVVSVTASHCGATPGACEEKKSDVFAPEQVTSVKDSTSVRRAMTWAKFLSDRLQAAGASGTWGCTPAAAEWRHQSATRQLA